MLNSIVEFMERALGPLLFVAGVTMLTVMLGTQSDLLREVKEIYASDSVYSQDYYADDYSETISGDELFAVLASGPTVTMQIVNNRGVEKVYVEPLSNGSLSIRVTKRNGTVDNEVYNETMFNLQGFPRAYVQSGEYTQDYSYSSNGELTKVTYTHVG